MVHRAITRLAGAVVLGSGLLLGAASPALADEAKTGPNSAACQEATEQRAEHQRQADEYQAQADEFEAMAVEHDKAAAEADALATMRQKQAAAKDALAAEQQQIADEADAEAQRQQQAAAEAEATGDIEARDKARAAAAEARAARDEARDRAEAAIKARDDARDSAQAARDERDAQREEAREDRERRDARLAQVQRQVKLAGAVDMSVCAESTPTTPTTECPDGEVLKGDECVPENTTPKPEECEDGQQRNDDGECVTPPTKIDLNCDDFPLADGATAQDVLDADSTDPHNLDGDNDGEACEAGGGNENTDTCDNAGVISDDGKWAWNCEEWILISEDDGAAPEGGIETGEGALAYTGVGNTLGWLAGGLGLVGAGALAIAGGPRLLRRS